MVFPISSLSDCLQLTMTAPSHDLQVVSTSTNWKKNLTPSQAYLGSQVIQSFREESPGLEPDLEAKWQCVVRKLETFQGIICLVLHFKMIHNILRQRMNIILFHQFPQVLETCSQMLPVKPSPPLNLLDGDTTYLGTNLLVAPYIFLIIQTGHGPGKSSWSHSCKALTNVTPHNHTWEQKSSLEEEITSGDVQ